MTYNQFITNRYKLVVQMSMLTYSMALLNFTVLGPMSKTMVDFWRLIWQEKPPTIVMVTNIKEDGKVKCEQYWPDSGAKRFGPFQITITDQQMFADYTVRVLQVTVSGYTSMAGCSYFHHLKILSLLTVQT